MVSIGTPELHRDLQPISAEKCSSCSDSVGFKNLYQCRSISCSTVGVFYFCEDCVSCLHRKHNIVDSSGETVPLCSEHGRVCVDFCDTCENFFCANDYRNHCSHKILNMDDIESKLKRRVSEIEKAVRDQDKNIEFTREAICKIVSGQKSESEIFRQTLQALITELENALVEEKDSGELFHSKVTQIMASLDYSVELKTQLKLLCNSSVAEKINSLNNLEKKIALLSEDQEISLTEEREKYTSCLETQLINLRRELNLKLCDRDLDTMLQVEMNDTLSSKSSGIATSPSLSDFIPLKERSPAVSRFNDEEITDEGSDFFTGCNFGTFFNVRETEGKIKIFECEFSEDSLEVSECLGAVIGGSRRKYVISHVFSMYCCFGSKGRMRLLILTEDQKAFLYDCLNKTILDAAYPKCENFLWPYCLNMAITYWAYWNKKDRTIRFEHTTNLIIKCSSKPVIRMSYSTQFCAFFDEKSKKIIRVRTDPRIQNNVETVEFEEHKCDKIDMISYPFWNSHMVLWEKNKKSVTVLEKSRPSSKLCKWKIIQKVIWETGFEILSLWIREDLQFNATAAVKSRYVRNSAKRNVNRANKNCNQHFIFLITGQK